MSAAPSGSDTPSGDEPESFESGEGSRAASDPEEARKAAEEALADIEAMADLDEDVESGASTGPEEGPDSSFGGGVSDTGESESSEQGTPEDQCENCGALLHGPYCSQCGQRAADRIVPIWHMINEALEAAFELDMRVIHTLPKLFFLPGRLTKDYINGRRKRYIRPFRLYLFSTFLLFATLAVTTGGFGLTLGPEGSSLRVASPGASTSEADTTDAVVEEEASDENWREEAARDIEQDSVSINLDVGSPSTNERLERRLRTNLAQALREPGEFVGTMIDYGPYVMFFMLPVFALILKLLYLRRGRLFVEHLIFSLHQHAFAFFAFTFGILLGETNVDWLRTAGIWIEGAPFLYLLLGMWHVYEQGFFKTAVKYFIVLTMYSIVLSFGFAVLLVAAIILM